MRGSSYKRCESVYLAVPTRVVVDVDDACCSSSIDASLHEGVVLGKVGGNDIASRGVASQELPAHRKTEDVEAIVIDEVLHLAGAVRTIVLRQWWPRSAGRAGCFISSTSSPRGMLPGIPLHVSPVE